ncbi:hypothetical protein OROGR_018450 [Orobanche gracilis]
MTFDDHSSIYVGGLPYDITDDSLRRVFCIYGAVLAVKIINDRSSGGKCYGFLTFANPRSAMQAIDEMDGKTIDGRIVKVDEVRSRGGKRNLKYMSFRHDMKRSSDGDRGRDRGSVGNYGRQLHHEEDREGSHEKGQNRERGHDRCVDEERCRDSSRRMDGTEQEHGRKLEGDCDKDIDMNIEQRNSNHHKSGYKHKHQQFHLLNSFVKMLYKWQSYMSRSRYDDNDGSKVFDLESFNDDEHQEENSLAVSSQKLEELRQERSIKGDKFQLIDQVSQLENLVADKQKVVSKLQENYQKLEESLVSATKFTSRRHVQLAKLHKCYLHMRDSDKILKRSEQELQVWLINSTKTELGNAGGGAVDDVVNGRALT